MSAYKERLRIFNTPYIHHYYYYRFNFTFWIFTSWRCTRYKCYFNLISFYIHKMLKNKVLIVAYHVESRRVASSAVFFYFKHTLLIELNDIKLSL